MGIDPADLTDQQKQLMPKADRKKIGRRGMTRAEALHIETSRLERKIHDQFSNFCLRNHIDVWHSNPTKKSSIGTGLPDFLCLKNGYGIGIEFKVAPNKLSAIQEQQFTILAMHGNEVHVCEETGPGEAYKQATALCREFFNLEEISE